MRRRLAPLAVPLALLGCLALLKDESSAAAAPARQAWLYKISGQDGWFRKETGKRWVETTPDGRQFQFQEAARRAKYIELFDRSRTMRLRLYASHIEFRQGRDSAWHRLYDGRWVKAADLPKPPKREYRIRLAYFVPSDRKPTPDYAQKIRVLMHFVAEVYRQDFEARKIRSKGLRFESRGGRPVVHLVRGRRSAAFYNNAPNYDFDTQWKHILPEIPARVGLPSKNVIIIFAETYDSGPAKFEWPGGVALGGRLSTEGGVGLFSAWILRPEFCATTVKQQKKWLFDTTPIRGRTAHGHGRPNSPRFEFIEDGFGAVAHELGHALGLPHDTRQDHLSIMGNGFRNLRWNFTVPPDPKRRARFSDDNARILYTSRYLASNLVLSDRVPPTVQMRWAAPLKAGSTTVKVSVTATDNEGLRAILFYSAAQDSVVGGRALRGKKQTFEQTLTVRPLRPGPFRVKALVADAGGNLADIEATGTVGK
jgi:hypothetical protein